MSIFINKRLRVIHYPDASKNDFFEIKVKDEHQACFIIDNLNEHHLWLFNNNFIANKNNKCIVEMFDKTINETTNEPIGWVNYYNYDELMNWDEISNKYLLYQQYEFKFFDWFRK